MKFLVLTSAILLLSTVASLEREKILLNFIQINTEIRNLLRNVFFDLNFVDVKINELILNLEQNITDLRKRYETSKFDNSQSKFHSKCMELSGGLKSDADCSRYALDMMKKHNDYQTILSSSISNALIYWIEQHDTLNAYIIADRSGLSYLENDAHDCGERFDASEESCVKEVYDKALHSSRISNAQAIKTALDNLIKRTDEALEKLNADLKDVFHFYDSEEWICDSLTKNCPKSPKNITGAI